ncbi:MAG: Rieske 2Fe-2S domain-containing protein, partial [Rhodothermales bacterium]
MFLRNQWYVAAWSHEVGRTPLARLIASEPIVFWRTEAGQAVAFEDACPHRLAPLSKGHLVGDALQCGYHGVMFDSEGKCIQVPGQHNAPKGCAVHSYRLEERWGMIWLWLGEPKEADTSLIPDFHWMAAEGWAPVSGLLHFKGHYQLLVDNLLDLTHETFLHAKTIGNPPVAETPAETTSAGKKVRVRRVMQDVSPPPL